MKRIFLMLVCVLLLGGCARAEGDELRLFAVNVGKADCLLLAYEDYVYMIDTGTNQSWGAVSCALKMLGIERLNGVIVTHTDSDHTGGCMALASSPIQVDAWYTSRWYNGVKHGKHPVVQAAALRGQDVHYLSAGDTLPFGRGRLTVLGPLVESDIENCNSVVLLAEGGGGSMLLAGDMEFPEENSLLAAGVLPQVTLLKVGNHAEGDATSEAFVQALQPRAAVISTNTDEEPDTPSGRVLKVLKRAGAQIAVTQNAEAGILAVISRGEAELTLAAWASMPPAETGVRLTAKDNRQFTTQITNTADHSVDLSGWFIHSERGNELFVFPAGSILESGRTITITCLSTPFTGDYLWQDEKVWHKSKSDPGVLYDVYGREIDRME